MATSSTKLCDLLCHLNVRLGLAVCGILLGVFWSSMYIFVFKNWIALCASCLSTLFACLTLYIYILQKFDIFQTKLSARTRYNFMIVNGLGVIVSVVAFFTTITFAICLKQGISTSDQYGQNLWSTCTWFLILFKWTLQNTLTLRVSLREQ